MKPADIDSLADGTLIYNASGVALGVVKNDFIMNGNYAPKPTRRLDIGRYRPRWKERGPRLEFQAGVAAGGRSRARG